MKGRSIRSSHDVRLVYVSDATSGLKKFIFWDYRRAVWQYDLMVGIILLFIFLTPREWFHDQPRANSVVMVTSPLNGTSLFWIEPGLLSGSLPEKTRQAAALVKARYKKPYNVVSLEEIPSNSETEILGYMAHTKP